MNTMSLLRVSSIRVDGLFDLFDHRVDLKLADRLTILHGPNGVGKTMLLKMVNDLTAGRYGLFRQVPFKSFLLEFDNGEALELVCEQGKAARRGKRSPVLRLHLLRNGRKIETHELSQRDETVLAGVERLAARLPWLRQFGPDEWIDEREGRVLSADELYSTYVDGFSQDTRLAINQKPRSGPDWLSQLRAGVVVYLIEAQRLFRLGAENGRSYPQRERSFFRVRDCANGMETEIARTMAHFGQQSQGLDQTFPQRLLSAPPVRLTRAELKERMDDLDARRSALKDIGLLDKPEVHPFDTNQLDSLNDAQQGVMSLYVRDTSEKLEVLSDLAKRARLLLDNVNQKFLHKHIRLDREAGLVAERADGTPLKLEALSSGEQHELVLHYDLLFRVKPSTLVLIDEPELSLHVAWQSSFLEDLLTIVKTRQFDVLLATHSPYIVGDRSDLMIGLDAEPNRT